MTTSGVGAATSEQSAGSCTLNKDPALQQQDASEANRKKRQSQLNENVSSHSRRENAGEVYYDGNDDRSNH